MSILGNRVLRREDPALLTRGGTYVDDLHLPGSGYVTFVRSTMAHARIEIVDLDEVRTAPGVLDVVTVAELDDFGLADRAPDFPLFNQAMGRPLLARDVVRFVGEPIVAVVTEHRYQGEDAAELAVIDYEPLDAMVGAPAARDDGAVLLFPDAGTNVAMDIDGRSLTADLSSCDVVVRQRIVNQRMAASPIEPRVSAARWVPDAAGESRRLELYIACQGTHPIRAEVAQLYGLDPEAVRVVCPDVGGGFGAKAPAYPESLVLGVLAHRVDRPVTWAESRSENMVGMGHGRAQVQEVAIGGGRDGRITGYQLDVVQDAGAYPAMGAVLPWMTRSMVTGVYDLTNVGFSAQSVVTTTTPTAAFRGAGRPEATAAVERAVDLFAAEIGMDPAEVRRRNLVAPEAFPYTTAAGTEYDTGDYPRALELALETVGYDRLRDEQRRRREVDPEGRSGPLLGIGIGVYVEITAFEGGGEFGSVELRTDGSVLVRTGSNPYGQGHHTAWTQLVSDRLGLPFDRIDVVHGDTDVIPSGSITGGSRSVQIAGTSIWEAAGNLEELARQRVADELEADPADIVLDKVDGRFHVAGVPTAALDWAAIAALALEQDGVPLTGISDFSAAGATFPFGAHVAVVEIDAETGLVRLDRIVAVDDAGRILNPMLAEGQVHGGLAQGVAQALLEEVCFDEDGNPLTGNFADYPVISACEVPMFDRVPLETPTPRNPLGAKGIGESGTIGATPAVQNAVIDALAHLGVRHVDMPCTPEKVWRAIQDHRSS